MGMRNFFGKLMGGGAQALAGSVATVAEVFVENKEAGAQRDAQRFSEVQASSRAEYHGEGLFNRLVDGLCRLPRPVLALGTVGLFVYAMVDPAGFTIRMLGLGQIPDPLWWLLGAVVSFYFGSRELHYLRKGSREVNVSLPKRSAPAAPAEVIEDNPALTAWRQGQRE